MAAKDIYQTIIFFIGLLLSCGSLSSLALYSIGEQTISEWLRANILWFWVPVIALAVLLLILGLHLYLQGKVK